LWAACIGVTWFFAGCDQAEIESPESLIDQLTGVYHCTCEHVNYNNGNPPVTTTTIEWDIEVGSAGASEDSIKVDVYTLSKTRSDSVVVFSDPLNHSRYTLWTAFYPVHDSIQFYHFQYLQTKRTCRGTKQ
jgi:hypothetical protein